MSKNEFAKMLAQLIREYQASGFVNGTILDSFAEFLEEKTFEESEIVNDKHENKLKLMSYNERDNISYVLNTNIASGEICIDHRSFSIFPNGCDECGADPILFQYSLGEDMGTSEDHYCAICIYKQLTKKKS